MLLALAPLVTREVEEIATSQTVWDFLSSGGPVMVPIALCSIVMVAFAFERLMNLKSERLLPERLKEALSLIRQGGSDTAARVCDEVDAPASRILQAGIRRKGMGIAEVEHAMEDQAHKEVDKLRANIGPLNLIAGIAPLLGLLGTVIGIQEAFHRVVKTGLGKPENLAGGIEQALVTTIAGLCVAIPALLIASHLNAKVRRLMIGVDEQLSPVVEHLAGEQETKHAA